MSLCLDAVGRGLSRELWGSRSSGQIRRPTPKVLQQLQQTQQQTQQQQQQQDRRQAPLLVEPLPAPTAVSALTAKLAGNGAAAAARGNGGGPGGSVTLASASAAIMVGDDSVVEGGGTLYRDHTLSVELAKSIQVSCRVGDAQVSAVQACSSTIGFKRFHQGPDGGAAAAAAFSRADSANAQCLSILSSSPLNDTDCRRCGRSHSLWAPFRTMAHSHIYPRQVSCLRFFKYLFFRPSKG